MSEFPHPLPWKRYGLVALGLLILNLTVWLIAPGSDFSLSVATFTLIYVVIWLAIKLFDTEKAYRKRHAASPQAFALTTLMEVGVLMLLIYVYFVFTLDGREPLTAFAAFLSEKFASSRRVAIIFVVLMLFFGGYMVVEFFRGEDEASH